jgi:putative peptidoglycan lipid II flippase
MGKLFSHLSVVSLLTLLSRFLGLGRDILFFSCFGASLIGEAFILAFTFPNLFRRMFGEGTLTSAFLPIFTETNNGESRANAFTFLNQVITRMILFLGVLSFVVCSFSYFGGRGEFALLEKWKVGLFLNGISFSYIIFICISALIVASLNSFGRFFEGAFSPVMLNLCMIVAMLAGKYVLLLEDIELASLLCMGVILAGILQLTLPWIQLQRLFGWKWRFTLSDSNEFTQLKSLFWVGALGAAVGQANILISRLFAYTLDGSGGMSYLFISSRLIELPLGIFAISIATVYFPEMSKAKSLKDEKNFWEKALSGLRLTAAITIPSAVGLALLGDSILTTLFRWGEFGAEEVTASNVILAIYCVGLPFYALSTFLVKVFHSEKNMRIPVQAAFVSLAVNVLLSIALIGEYQAKGLAWANVISAILQTCYLCFRMNQLKITSLFQRNSISLPGIFLSALVMWFIISSVQGMMGGPQGKFDHAINLLIMIPMGLISYTGVLFLCGFPELKSLSAKFGISKY